jgi:hypothetical protein
MHEETSTEEIEKISSQAITDRRPRGRREKLLRIFTSGAAAPQSECRPQEGSR